MELPNIPTDNLYKFMSLTGILFVVFFYIYPLTRLDKISYELSCLEGEMSKLNTTTEILDLKLKALSKEGKILEKRLEEKYGKTDSLVNSKDNGWSHIDKFLEKLHNKEYRDYIKFTYDYETKIFPEKSESEKYSGILDSITEASYKLEMTKAEIKSKKIQILENVNREHNWFWIDIIGILIGAILMLIGFRKWYYKVQIPLDKKLQLENKLLEINLEKEKPNT